MQDPVGGQAQASHDDTPLPDDLDYGPESEGTQADQVQPGTAQQPSQEQQRQIDLAALEAQVRQRGQDYTLENIPQKIDDLKKGMTMAQRELAQWKENNRAAMDLQEQIRLYPGLGDHLLQQAREYYEGRSEEIPQSVTQAIDPVSLRVNQIESQLYGFQMDRDINDLRNKYGQENLDAETERKIYERVAETGSSKVEDHFKAIKFDEMMLKTRQSASQETADKIAKNQSSYVVNRGSGVPQSKPFNPVTATPEEAEAEFEADIEKALSDGAI